MVEAGLTAVKLVGKSAVKLADTKVGKLVAMKACMTVDQSD